MNMSIFLTLPQVQKSSSAVRDKGFNFDDVRLMRGAWRNEPNPDACKVDYFNFCG